MLRSDRRGGRHALLRLRRGRLPGARSRCSRERWPTRAHLVCYAAKANDALALAPRRGPRRARRRHRLGRRALQGAQGRASRPSGSSSRASASAATRSGRRSRPASARSTSSHPVELDLIAEEAAGARTSSHPSPSASTPTSSPTPTSTSPPAGDEQVRPRPPQRCSTSFDGRPRTRRSQPVGISFHVGSQLLDPAPDPRGRASGAATLWRALAAEGVQLRDLDVGGGLGVPYEGDARGRRRPYATALAAVASRARSRRSCSSRAAGWSPPPGRSSRGCSTSRRCPARRIAVCDGGMNDLIRPSLYGALSPDRGRRSGGEPPAWPVDVVGPVCESGDFFARGRDLPLPDAGRPVAIGLAGAYGRVMASTYNARPLCAEVLVEGGSWRVIREAGRVRGPRPRRERPD